MQILVVVAIIQIRILKAEEEKGFTTTVFGRDLVGPKPLANAFVYVFHSWSRWRKGSRLIFLHQDVGILLRQRN